MEIIKFLEYTFLQVELLIFDFEIILPADHGHVAFNEFFEIIVSSQTTFFRWTQRLSNSRSEKSLFPNIFRRLSISRSRLAFAGI